MRRILGLLLLLVTAAPLAHARDIVSFGRTEWISSTDQVDDIVCAFCTIHIDGQVHGDVVTAFSRIEFGPEVQVSGDVVTAFSRSQFKGDNRINGDMVSFGSNIEALGSLIVAGDRVSMPGIVAWLILAAPFAFAAFIVWLIVKLVQRRRSYAYPPLPGHPFPRA